MQIRCAQAIGACPYGTTTKVLDIRGCHGWKIALARTVRAAVQTFNALIRLPLFTLNLFHFNSGSEIYVGCDNGELLRFALQASTTDAVRPIQSTGFPANYR